LLSLSHPILRGVAPPSQNGGLPRILEPRGLLV
jgi:hypothetical protein